MHIKSITYFLIFSTYILSCSSSEKLHQRPIGLINNVSFKNSKFDNPNASNGFLVQHDNNIYAITAKHILMISKTDKMKFVDFEGELKQWKMHPKDNKDSYVIMDELISSNRKDSLTWSYMTNNWESYNDWIIFSVKENKTDHKPLKFRQKPLEQGEALYAIGWTYSDTIGSQRIYEYTFEETEGNYHNLIQVKGPERLGGLSGSPVVDKKGKLVGLVTSGWADEKSNKVYLQATSSKNMLRFLSKLR